MASIERVRACNSGLGDSLLHKFARCMMKRSSFAYTHSRYLASDHAQHDRFMTPSTYGRALPVLSSEAPPLRAARSG